MEYCRIVWILDNIQLGVLLLGGPDPQQSTNEVRNGCGSPSKPRSFLTMIPQLPGDLWVSIHQKPSKKNSGDVSPSRGLQ